MEVYVVVQTTYPFGNREICGVWTDALSAKEWVEKRENSFPECRGEFTIIPFPLIDNNNKISEV